MRIHLTREHTITSSWSAKDASGQRVVCNANAGCRLADVCRPSSQVNAETLFENDRFSIVVPSSSAACPLEMVRAAGSSTLAAFISARLSILEKTAIASSLAREVAKVHACHILHGRISLSSFRIDPSSKVVEIVDFTSAVHLAAGSSVPDAALATLSDMAAVAPEAGGRSIGQIDHRIDLYALGCVLYHLFAGRPVFAIDDKVALRHAHLAKLPEPLHAVADLPAILSDIVMSLLSKQPEDRYQRAEDLLVDLGECLSDLRREGSIKPFALRLKSRVKALACGELLYGRNSQRQQLTDALAAARAGKPQRLLVTGASGIGKSALCRHFIGEARQRGMYAAMGKFEQFHTGAPYLGIIRCLEDLTDTLLTNPAGVVGERTGERAGKKGDDPVVLRGLVPTLEDSLGFPRLQESLGAFGARDRLAQNVLTFLASIASTERPVTLFFDDLQWADIASLDLLGRVSDELSGCVVLVGICRLDRDAPDALLRAKVALSSKGEAPLQVDLIALTRSDVEDLLSDVFGPKGRRLEAASLLYGKTLGSPLFICQCLGRLADDTVPDPNAAWDLGNLAALESVADVVDFLSGRITSLDPVSRSILATGACFGMSFERDELVELTGIDADVLADRLSRLITDGFFAQIAETCFFVHDRVRETAYRLAEDRGAIHRAIASRLLTTKGGAEAHAFDVVRHLKAAGDLSKHRDLTEGFILASHFAARRAHAAAAFDLAREYAVTALRLSEIDRWAAGDETLAATLLVKADSTILLQDHDTFDLEYEGDRARLCSVEDRLRLALLRVMSLDARARFEEALSAGLGDLRSAGIDLPEERDRQREAVGVEFSAFKAAIVECPPDRLIDLPPLVNSPIAISMQILFRLAPSAHNTMRPELFALMALRNTNMMLRHGRDALASGVTMTLALALAGLCEDITFAEQFARAAMEIDPKEGRRTPASVSFVYSYFFSHWLNPVEASLPTNLAGMRTGFEMGDIQFGCFHAAAYVIHLAASGAPLPDVVRAGREHESMIAGRIWISSFHCGLEIDFANALQGMTAAPTCLATDRVASVADVMREAGDLFPSERGFFLARHLQLAYFFRDMAAASVYAAAATATLPVIERKFVSADVVTFSILTALATSSWPSVVCDENLARLRAWSTLNVENFGCRFDLVRAEIARHDGRHAEAIGLYVQALAAARRYRFVHLAALASELAGRFFLGLGDDVASIAYLREAVGLYGQWGARAKVSALCDEFPNLSAAMAIADIEDGPDTALGFDAVLAAARSISAEIDLHRLLQKIMTSVQEISGATYGALVLTRDTGHFVEVASRHGEGVIVCDASAHPAKSSQLVPAAVIARVEQDQTILVVKNAVDSEFARDPYVRLNGVLSVLCAPLVGRGRLDGFIYLENTLTAGAFDPRSAQVLQVLAAQGAVALANARLFALLDCARSELAGVNEDLERRIEARTNELASARNIALEKAAEADRASHAARSANEAKSRFLSVVSHEIRTPMNGILGMLQLLDRERLDGQQRRQVDLAQQSGFTLVKLIDGILDYSRLELGVDGASREDFGLDDLVDSAVEIFRSSIEAKSLRLAVDIRGPAGVRLESDARGIARVVMNLVGNAVKFTAQGSITVTMTLLETAASPPILHVTVRDTGVGISAEMQTRIFEDFVQADASIARRYGGSGLGLAISHRIVRLLGGTLTVESELGFGSVFKAEIPVSIGSRAETSSTSAMSALSGEPLSLLVVDDDAINREVASGLLESLGHTVVCAESCEAAIATVACCVFDAVMLDLHMPGIDGIETARRIRVASGSAPCPPIILLTADTTEASRRRCREAGITRILPKPLRLEALQAMLVGLGEGAPSPMLSRDGPIDKMLFAERCELLGLPQMVRLILQYHRSSRQTIEAIQSAAAMSDRRSVVRLAHRLRSASGSLQFGEMEDVAHRLETAASSDEEALDTLVTTLRDARRRLSAAAIGEIRALRLAWDRSAAQRSASPIDLETEPVADPTHC